jgi:hypothetical protein
VIQGQQRPGSTFLTWLRIHIITIILISFIFYCLIVSVIGIRYAQDPNNTQIKNLFSNLFSILWSIVIPLLGLILTFLQVYFIVNPPSNRSTQPSTIPLPLPFPPVDNHFARISMNHVPPYTSSRVILPCREFVKHIYKNFNKLDITFVVITGLAGIGKSTLAALIYQYHHSASFLRKMFTTKPLWLELNSQVKFVEVVEGICNYLGQPLPPNFNDLNIDAKTTLIAQVLEKARKSKLVILDQLDSWLDCKTGYALPEYSDLDALLYAVDSQMNRCHIVFTSRIWPQVNTRGTASRTKDSLTEYIVKNLALSEGIILLQKRGVIAKSVELEQAVKYCNGHAGALAALALLLQEEPTLRLNSTRCTQRWEQIVVDKILKRLYLEFDQEQLDVLACLCVFRTPVPPETIWDTTNLMISNDRWESLNILLRQHMLQKSDGDCYCLHPMIANCSQDYLFKSNLQALQVEHVKAARFYQQLGWPAQADRKSSKDVQNLIEVIWHLCCAECWVEAYNLMVDEGITQNLTEWGDNLLLLELNELFLPYHQN